MGVVELHPAGFGWQGQEREANEENVSNTILGLNISIQLGDLLF